MEQHPTVKITVLSKPFLKSLFTDIKNVTFCAANVNNKRKGFWGIDTLFKELNLISKLDCTVSMGSGNAHFSATPCVSALTIW